MRYLSLFSGIEAATAAWHTLGWEAVAFAEIEPFPCSALAHHYPDVPNLGDVTKIDETTIALLGPIDLVVFGSPCQDLSVAGKRKGLAGERSGLFHTAINIIEWAREYCGCRYALWENVPGAFSSNGGADFAAVVEQLAGVPTDVPPKGWGTEGCAIGEKAMVEWAVLDAQWFGVAQRRRRVFALADFGDWRGRQPILLEPESLRGDSAPRRETGQGAVADVARSLTRRHDSSEDGTGRGLELVCVRPGVAGYRMTAFGEYVEDETASTMKQRDHKGATDLIAFHSNAQPDQMNFDEHTSASLTCSQQAAVAYGLQANTIDRQPHNGGNGFGFKEEVSPTLTKMDRHAVAFAQNQLGEVRTGEVANTISTNSNASGRNTPMVQTGMQVRRLTPRECERLQGFPDDYTVFPNRGKPAADGPRYKALGNSMAVPVMRWIGEQLEIVRLFQ